MSQSDLIYNYLKPPGRYIDPMKALRLFGCWSLSSRISDLRKRKIKIHSELIHDKKKKKVYARYSLS